MLSALTQAENVARSSAAGIQSAGWDAAAIAVALSSITTTPAPMRKRPVLSIRPPLDPDAPQCDTAVGSDRGGHTPVSGPTGTGAPYPGGVSDRDARREEILALASGMFARSGFHGVSMDELGAALGVSGPALYRYFPGKEAILSAMLVDISERLLAGGRERALSARGARETLESLVEFHVDFALDQPDLIAVQSRDLDAVPDADRRLVRRLQAQYVDLWVDALQEVHDVTPDRARAGAHAVFGLINSTPHSARLTRPEMAALLRSMALSALATTPRPRVQ